MLKLWRSINCDEGGGQEGDKGRFKKHRKRMNFEKLRGGMGEFISWTGMMAVHAAVVRSGLGKTNDDAAVLCKNH